MSLEEELAANTAELKLLRVTLEGLGTGWVAGEATELAVDYLENKVETEVIIGNDRSGSVEEQLAEDVKTDEAHAEEIATDTMRSDEIIPAPEDRPYALKGNRRPTQVVKLEKAEKAGNPDDIAEAKLALCEFNVSKGKRELSRLNNIETTDAKQAIDKEDAIRYAEHDMMEANKSLEAIKALTVSTIVDEPPAASDDSQVEIKTTVTPTPPAATKEVPTPTPPVHQVNTRGCPEGFEFTETAVPVELQYSDYTEAGWTNDTLISEGYMQTTQDKPEVVIDIEHLREQMMQMAPSKGGPALTATIGKYAPTLDEIKAEDYDVFLDDLQHLPTIEQ